MYSFAKFLLTTSLLSIFFLTNISSSYGSGTMPSESGMAKHVMFHGKLLGRGIADGDHIIHVRLYRKDGALIHDEELHTQVRQGMYDVMLGSTKQLIANTKDEYLVAVSVDNGNELRDGTKLKVTASTSEDFLSATLVREQNKTIEPIDHGEVSATLAEREALDRGQISSPFYGGLPTFSPFYNPMHGLNIEMSLASPGIPTMNYYDMAKYGRINVELNNFASFDGDPFGIAAQAMHVAHHLLLYAGGFTTDVNNDGMFLFTLGAAHYQTGDSRSEPFVDAPFIRMKYHTSNAAIFGYSEIETTVHSRSYLSGTVGIGLRLTEKINIIAGVAHTEFIMPTEEMVREVDGFHGILNWSF